MEIQLDRALVAPVAEPEYEAYPYLEQPPGIFIVGFKCDGKTFVR
jgi:hypothetical protein